MGARYIGGDSPAAVAPTLARLWAREGVASTVDLLGERCLTEPEADAYLAKYVEMAVELPRAAVGWPAAPALERDAVEAAPRANVSVKLSAITPRFEPADLEGTVEDLVSRMRPLLATAASAGTHLHFDMEDWSTREITLETVRRAALIEPGLSTGVTLQAYLRTGDADAAALAEWCCRNGRRLTVRLVKGAYWDQEAALADALSWHPPRVWTSKRDTDACFERMAARLLDAAPRDASEGGVKLAVGTHNARSLAAALAAAEARGLPQEAVELQVLKGMAHEIKAAAAGELGLRVREYVPVGEMVPGMAYLVRRLLENTSNSSWTLAAGRAGFGLESKSEVSPDTAAIAALLASPHDGGAAAAAAASEPGAGMRSAAAKRHSLSPSPRGVGDGSPFLSEPALDFASEAEREPFAAAVWDMRARGLGLGAGLQTAPSTAGAWGVGTSAVADNAVDAAVSAAAAAFPAWADTDPRERAAVLTRTATAARARRADLAALLVEELGKEWREADGEVCEFIDFCEYYARSAVQLFEPEPLGSYAAESNEFSWRPRGVSVALTPFNFPLAIGAGTAMAPLVTGNTVLVSPSAKALHVASVIVDLFHDAGAPPECFRLLPGGPDVGEALVSDPRVVNIVFTGSSRVGRAILEAAARVNVAAGQRHIKRVIAEMGGKNAIIVDGSADLDEAVAGVAASAFGFAGQKCSACSRVIVQSSVAADFVKRLTGRAAVYAAHAGDPRDPATLLGPVVDAAAAARIRRVVAEAEESGAGRLAFLGPSCATPMPGREDAHVPPAVFVDVDTDSPLWTDEIFGPVLAVVESRDFSHALDLANASPYGLTGGVFSRTPAHLERARREFMVGNLYLNRPITGAMPGRQPFGGSGLSGVGSKAGGAAYLAQFVDPVVVTENTQRRGHPSEA